MRQTSVFIVDDDVDFAESIGMALEGRGCDVHFARSGEEAIRKFQERDYDIAFMDVQLPGKNGVESFLEIRKFKPKARVVMMTGYSVEQLLEQAVGGGAWGILQKPFDMHRVTELVEKVRQGGVLIVDDEPEFLDTAQLLLEGHGMKVFTAENGRQALECVEAHPIDVMVLDLRMPVMDGLETYLELHKLGYDIPTIIVSAYGDEESEVIERLDAESLCGILKKPFKFEKLLAAVEKLVKLD